MDTSTLENMMSISFFSYIIILYNSCLGLIILMTLSPLIYKRCEFTELLNDLFYNSLMTLLIVPMAFCSLNYSLNNKIIGLISLLISTSFVKLLLDIDEEINLI
jgi:hypothetical protein